MDSSPSWGSGWLLLSESMDFSRGDRLKVEVGGTATKVLVRLLAKNMDPNSSSGIMGGPMIVPKDRVVEVELDDDYLSVTQISVHGGPKPWGKYPLGGGNGPAELVSVTLLAKDQPAD